MIQFGHPILLLFSLFARRGFAQQVQCVTLAGGCDQGTKGDTALRNAIAAFQPGLLYGGTSQLVFSASLSEDILAQVAYSCLDGSVPPPLDGSTVHNLLAAILACPNRCGSVSSTVPVEGTDCGFGVLLVNGASEQACFSDVLNIIPAGVAAPPTSTITTSSSSAAPTPTPTLVVGVGNFNNIGCFNDASDALVLRANSTTGGSLVGMTVQSCIEFAEQAQWQYAGVESGGDCYVGNTLYNGISAPQADCKMACGGDASQLCGAESRIQVYQDSSWFNPTAADIVLALQEYSATLAEALDALNQYDSDLRQLQSDLQSSGSKLRKRFELSFTILADLNRIVQGSSVRRLIQGEMNTAVETLNRLFEIGRANDIPPASSDMIPLISREDPETLGSATSPVDNTFGDMVNRDAVEVPRIRDGIQRNIFPNLNIQGDLSALQTALNTIGKPAVLGVAAAGAIAVIAKLIDEFSKKPPPSTTISTTATSSSTCSPTPLPSDVIVVTVTDTTTTQFNNLLSQVKSDKDVVVLDFMNFANVDYRAFLATMDLCAAQKLLANRMVETVSLNAPVRMYYDEPSGPLILKREADPGDNTHDGLFGSSWHKEKQGKRSTGIVPSPYDTWFEAGGLGNAQGLPVAGPPTNLAWLTAPWAQRGLATDGSTYLNYEQYIFPPVAPIPPNDNVRVYILDSGVRDTHQDLVGKMRLGYDMHLSGDRTERYAPGRLPPVDTQGHGTSMACSVAGTYSGVHKNAAVVMIKLDATRGDDNYVLAWSISNAFAVIMLDKDEFNVDKAVVSMSFGVPPTQFQIPKSAVPRSDPFPRLLRVSRKRGIVPVAAAGNDAKAIAENDLSITTPTLHGGPDSNLITIGSVDYLGMRADSSTFLNGASALDILTAYAVGVRNLVCNYLGDDQYHWSNGSSSATAQVAGIVAMYLENGQTVESVKAHLISEAKRLKGVGWPVDDPRFGEHPRVGIGNQIPCGPADENSPTATIPQQVPQETTVVIKSSSFTAAVRSSTALSASVPSCVVPRA